MGFSIKHGGDVYLAHILQYEDTNALTLLWRSISDHRRYAKHSNQGSTIRRRSHHKEVQYGEAKSALSILKSIRLIATNLRNKLVDYDVDFNSKAVREEARRILDFLDNTHNKQYLHKYTGFKKFEEVSK
jgi:hypothetical protein